MIKALLYLGKLRCKIKSMSDKKSMYRILHTEINFYYDFTKTDHTHFIFETGYLTM